jgi:hypothetical protein
MTLRFDLRAARPRRPVRLLLQTSRSEDRAPRPRRQGLVNDAGLARIQQEMVDLLLIDTTEGQL